MAIPKYPPHPRWADAVRSDARSKDKSDTPAKGKPGRKPKA